MLICDTQAASTASTVTSDAFTFGFYWANPDTDATILYDGMRTTADLNIATPADFTTGSLTVSTVVSATTTTNDILPTEDEEIDAYDPTTDNVVLGITALTAEDLCVEWWTLDFPRMACVKWYQQFTRALDSADTDGDFVLDMTEVYTVTPFAGSVLSENYNFIQSEDVDFTDFTENLVSLDGLKLVCSVSAATLFTAILF